MASPFMTGPFVPVAMLNLIRAVLGIHHHRFNLSVKRSRGRPLTGSRQDKALQEPSGGRHRGHCNETAQGAGDGVGSHTSPHTGACEHGLVISKIFTIGIVQERAGPMHNPSVNARHNEGSKPGFEIAVVLRSAEALLTSFRLVIPWAKQIGLSHLWSEGWIFRSFFCDIDHACNNASRHAPP